MSDTPAVPQDGPMNGRIILLDGPSSAGKSTIAAALPQAMRDPFLHLSIDHLRDAGVLPLDCIRNGKFDWKAMREPFFAGFHRSLAAFAESGNDLIVEHIVEKQAWMSSLLTLLSPFDVFFVSVRCPLDELERREIARRDRPVGDARRDFMRTDVNAVYDLELDGTEPPEENVRKLVDAWQQRVSPSAFERMSAERA